MFIGNLTNPTPLPTDKFYFAIASNDGVELCLNIKSDKIIFYCAHNNLHYQGFIFDFGPYDLANCWKYCFHVRKFLKVGVLDEYDRIVSSG